MVPGMYVPSATHISSNARATVRAWVTDTLLPKGGSLAADVQLLLASADAEGGNAPVQTMMAHIEVPGSDAGQYQGQLYGARLQLLLPAGLRRVAIGLVDPLSGTTAFVSRDLLVGSP